MKPEFWRDSRIAELPDTTRLIYIALWMEADDAGWMRLEIPEVAHDIYPYSTRTTRERRVRQAVENLAARGRLEVHPCGHAQVPRLTVHQRLSSPEKRVLTIEREHSKCPPAGTRGELQTFHDAPTRNGTVREGEGKGKGNGGVHGSTVPPGLGDPREPSAPGVTR